MGVTGYNDLRSHIGHKVAVVCYGKEGQDPANVAVECEDCGCVLFDFDRPDKPYVIVGLRDTDDWTGEPLYWSNEHGWALLKNATRFSDEERRTVNLPVGGKWKKIKG